MGVYIPNMNKPNNCRTCKFKSNKEGECWFVHDENDCPLIEIDDTVWENEKYKLIRMTNEARINKAMAERRSDENSDMDNSDNRTD